MKKRKEKKEKKEGMFFFFFFMESSVFWMSRVIGMIVRVFSMEIGLFQT